MYTRISITLYFSTSHTGQYDKKSCADALFGSYLQRTAVFVDDNIVNNGQPLPGASSDLFGSEKSAKSPMK